MNQSIEKSSDSKKNILLFTINYPYSSDQTPEKTTRAIHYFCREWIKLGYQVTVVLLDINLFQISNIADIVPKLDLSESNEGVNVYKINVARLIPKSNHLFNFQNKGIEDELAKIIEFNKYSMIVAHFPMSYLDFLKRFLKKVESKVTFTLHNMDIYYLIRKRDKKFIDYIENNNINLLFRSKKIAKLYEGFSNKPLRNLSDSIVYSGAPETVKKNNLKVKNTFLYVGQLVKNKNVDITLKALANIKHLNFDFTIIGVGPEYKALVNLAKFLGIEDKVHFLGKKPRHVVMEYMEKSEYFVMVSSLETFGLVYIEALSKECITIATKGEGIDGVIRHFENGFLVNSNSVEALSDLIRESINMRQKEKDDLKRLAKLTAEKYSEKNVAIHYLEKIQGDKNFEYF